MADGSLEIQTDFLILTRPSSQTKYDNLLQWVCVDLYEGYENFKTGLSNICITNKWFSSKISNSKNMTLSDIIIL